MNMPADQMRPISVNKSEVARVALTKFAMAKKKIWMPKATYVDWMLADSVIFLCSAVQLVIGYMR